MKKLISLSLIFAALVFQSCNKMSYNTSDDLVPIAFTQAVATKTAPPTGIALYEGELEALVLGSRRPNDNWNNDWTTIYFSEAMTEESGDASGDPSRKQYYANDNITLNSTDPTKNTFRPLVAYPLDFDGSDTYIYIKALAPFGAIVKSSYPTLGGAVGPERVTFTINGTQDVIATRAIGTVGSTAPGVPDILYNSGTRAKPEIDLVFDHLLSKINFKIKLEKEAAGDYWGKVLSITVKGGYDRFDCILLNNTTELPTTPTTGDFLLMANTPGDGGTSILTTPENFGSLMVYPTTEEQVANSDYTWTIEVKTRKDINSAAIITPIELTVDLLKAKQHDITVTFNENKQLEFNVLITPWGLNSANDHETEI